MDDETNLCRNCGVEVAWRGGKWCHNASLANPDEYCEDADGFWPGTTATPTTWTDAE